MSRRTEVKWIVNDPDALFAAIKKNNKNHVQRESDLDTMLCISDRSLDRVFSAHKDGVTVATLMPVFGLLTDIPDRLEKAARGTFTKEERAVIQTLIKAHCRRLSVAGQNDDEEEKQEAYLKLYTSYLRVNSLGKKTGAFNDYLAVKSLHFSEKPNSTVDIPTMNPYCYKYGEIFAVTHPPGSGHVLDDYLDIHYDVKPAEFIQCVFMGTDILTPSDSVVIELLPADCDKMTLVVDFSAISVPPGGLFNGAPVCFMSLPEPGERFQMSVMYDEISRRCYVDSDYASSIRLREPGEGYSLEQDAWRMVEFQYPREGADREATLWEHGTRQWLPPRRRMPKGTKCEFEFFIDWNALQ